MQKEQMRLSVIALAASLTVLALATISVIGWWIGTGAALTLSWPTDTSPYVVVCFWLAGLSLLLPRGRFSWQRHAQITAGCLIIILSALVLFVSLFNVATAIDQLISHQPAAVGRSVFSGHLPFNGSLGLLAGGLVLVLMHFASEKKWAGIATQFLTFLVLAIGVTGSLIHVLNLDLLYSWHHEVRTTAYCSGGLIALSVALTATWTGMPWARSLYQGHEDQKISMIGGAILVVIATVTGVGTFAILQRKTETALTRELAMTLRSRADFFGQTINMNTVDAQFIATRPALLAQLVKLESDPGNRSAVMVLQDGVRRFVEFGYIAVALYDNHGRMIVHSGRFIDRPQADIRLNLPYDVRLLWHDGIVLRTYMPMTVSGRIVGFVQTEKVLPYLAKMFQDFRALGATSDMAVCARLKSNVVCLPLRDIPRPISLPLTLNEQSLPMSHALAGQSGVIAARDYRDKHVIAAFGPIGSLGLGMVVKIDTAELYDPIRKPLEYSVPLLLVLVLSGTIMLRLQITPLVRRIIRSEQESHNMRLALEHVVDGVSQIDERGCYLSVDAGYAGLTGYRPEELVGKEFSVIIHPDDRESMQKAYEGMRREGRSEVEVRVVRKDGIHSHMQVSMVSTYDQNHDLIGQYCFMKDISERKRTEQALQSMSFIDELTGLHNRRGFLDLANERLKLSRRSQKDLLMFFIDVDDMKPINDEFGHRAGDAALISLAQILRSTFRDSDVVGRLGGDEFAAIAADTGEDGGSVITERLRRNLARRNASAGPGYRLEVSVGAVRYRPDSETSLEELMMQADRLMYQDKQERKKRRTAR